MFQEYLDFDIDFDNCFEASRFDYHGHNYKMDMVDFHWVIILGGA